MNKKEAKAKRESLEDKRQLLEMRDSMPPIPEIDDPVLRNYVHDLMNAAELFYTLVDKRKIQSALKSESDEQCKVLVSAHQCVSMWIKYFGVDALLSDIDFTY